MREATSSSRRLMKFRSVLILALAGTAFLTTMGATAHEGATGIVKHRMEMMKEMAKAMKALAPMVKGETAWNVALARASAATIAGHADKMPETFPEGSDGHPSEAKKTIWSAWDQFEESAEALRSQAARLEAAAAKGAQAAKPLFAEITNECKACHQDFREKKQ